MLSPIFDPLHGLPSLPGGQTDERDVGDDSDLDAEAAANVRRRDEAEPVFGNVQTLGDKRATKNAIKLHSNPLMMTRSHCSTPIGVGC